MVTMDQVAGVMTGSAIAQARRRLMHLVTRSALLFTEMSVVRIRIQRFGRLGKTLVIFVARKTLLIPDPHLVKGHGIGVRHRQDNLLEQIA